MEDSTRRTLLIAAGMYAGAVGAARMTRRIDFRNRVVLITGGSRGLGLVLARHFANEQARIAICARDEAELHAARSGLLRRGADVLAVQCDVTVKAQVDEMVRAVVDHFGRLDVLVNNAGTIVVGPVETMTLDDYADAMKTHFWAPLYAIMAAVPEMRRPGSGDSDSDRGGGGGGRIVNISSIAGKISPPHLLPYNASKFALTGLSEGLRAELARDGVFVTTVCPGLMRTGSPRNALFKGRHRDEYAWFSIADSLPLTSMSADRAARKIIRACRYGQSEVVLSAQARLAAKFHALFPGVAEDLMAVINDLLLPGAQGGIGQARARGAQSQSPITRSNLTRLSRQAEMDNNQLRQSETPIGGPA